MEAEYHQAWDTRKSLIENLWQREEYALFNSQTWMANCHGLSLETLNGIAEGENPKALIEEVGDYQGPTALLRDAAGWLAGQREWRKAFRPVLDAAGWREYEEDKEEEIWRKDSHGLTEDAELRVTLTAMGGSMG